MKGKIAGIIMLAVTAFVGFGSESTKMLDSLVSRGNRAYELSQSSRIKECADSLASFLDDTGLEGDALKDYRVSLYKLYGNYHYVTSSLDSAEYYYDKARKMIAGNPTTSFRSDGELLMLRECAQLYYRLQDYRFAADLMAAADSIMEYRQPYELGDDNWLITKMTYAMCLARLHRFEEALSIAETELSNAIDKSGLEFARAQRMYGKILLLAESDRSGALKAYKSYFNRQKKYALENFCNLTERQRAEYWETLQPFIADCYLLEEADPAFLYDVTLFSKGLLLQLSRLSGNGPATESALRTLGYNWIDIQKKLKKGQAAAEFIQYEKNGRQQMAALLLKSSGCPVFVHLTSPDEVYTYGGEALQTTCREGKDELYLDEHLHKMVWTDNMLALLKGVDRLYFAPDGYLHRLAIEYMPPVKDIDLYRLSSTRRIMDATGGLSANSPMLLMGGINYNLDTDPGAHCENDSSAYANYIGKWFPRLSDDSNEAKIIYKLRNNNADSLILTSKASENSFRNLAKNYESILVSTHGDFCLESPVSTDLKTNGDDAMSQNIIAFAGVNTYLKSPSFNAADNYDGLLSAKELSEIDLSRCKLFTVSACQSALGKISSDGVFGLQRGLKNAGVDMMLLSLWNVNSDATARLMQSFYLNLSEGKSVKKAFDAARSDILSGSSLNKEVQEECVFKFMPSVMASRKVKKPASTAYNSPQFTNAFILIDALD